MTELTDVVADDHLVDALAAGQRPDPTDPAAAALAEWRDEHAAHPNFPAFGEPLMWQEERILPLLAEGLTGPEIGRRLFLSPETVKTYARRIYRKLGANGRTHAVHLAHQQGLLGGEPS